MRNEMMRLVELAKEEGKKDLATYLGVSLPTVTRLINEPHRVCMGTWLKLEEYFNK